MRFWPKLAKMAARKRALDPGSPGKWLDRLRGLIYTGCVLTKRTVSGSR